VVDRLLAAAQAPQRRGERRAGAHVRARLEDHPEVADAVGERARAERSLAGSNENTNGLLRQYFPKGTDLARHSADDLAAVAGALNTRPRKTLGWRTPAEVLDEHLATAA